MQEFEQYEAEIAKEEITSKEHLEGFRLKWLSKKGRIQELYSKLKDVANEEKKQFGLRVNNLKNLIEAKLESVKNLHGNDDEIRQMPDLSLDGISKLLGGYHPLTLTRNRLVDIFKQMGFVISEGPEIVDDWHNFTALNIEENHPARDMQDTFFITQNPDTVLRTHTSSVQVQVMQSQEPPIRTISPGRVYRKDSDSTHSPVFHQIEGLYIDENVSFADLKQTLFTFVQEMFGEGTNVRFRPSFFPFTEPSAEMDIERTINKPDGTTEVKWMEILGCGMVDPAVLTNCGIDAEKYTGFAFGMGIERITMLKYGIQDIRMLFENDLRFLSQFQGE